MYTEFLTGIGVLLVVTLLVLYDKRPLKEGRDKIDKKPYFECDLCKINSFDKSGFTKCTASECHAVKTKNIITVKTHLEIKD